MLTYLCTRYVSMVCCHLRQKVCSLYSVVFSTHLRVDETKLRQLRFTTRRFSLLMKSLLFIHTPSAHCARSGWDTTVC